MTEAEEALRIIDAIHGSYHTGTKHGLTNIRALMSELDPENDLSRVPVIHVAGTNGKGSTCAMLESILRAAGLRTGLYTSPFLQAYPERIRMNGRPMTDALLVRYGRRVLTAKEKLEARGLCPTPFELGTALALTAFAGERVDAAVVEVGLGGRLDPTNIVSPALCVITAIGLDHMEFLGNTLPEIAAEKAGIIKPGVPVICQRNAPEVEEVFRRAAESRNAPLLQLTDSAVTASACDAHGSTVSLRLRYDWPELRVSLPGEHQLRNACTAVAAAEQLKLLGLPIPARAVYEGLVSVRWPARLEWCGSVLMDGAHNAQGLAALNTFVQRHLKDRRRVLLTGMLADKITDETPDILAALADRAVTVTPDNPRALDGERLAELLRARNVNAESAATLTDAIEIAKKEAGEDGIVIACGSLYLMGSLRTALGLDWH